MSHPATCEHDNVRTFRSIPPHSKCEDCGARVKLVWTIDPQHCPTCSGPIRETVGMVCQTCGTDYGRQS